MRNAKNILPDSYPVCSETFDLFRLHSRAVSETNDQAKVSAGTGLCIEINFSMGNKKPLPTAAVRSYKKDFNLN